MRAFHLSNPQERFEKATKWEGLTYKVKDSKVILLYDAMELSLSDGIGVLAW